jgi:hypothetical protein
VKVVGSASAAQFVSGEDATKVKTGKGRHCPHLGQACLALTLEGFVDHDWWRC